MAHPFNIPTAADSPHASRLGVFKAPSRGALGWAAAAVSAACALLSACSTSPVQRAEAPVATPQKPAPLPDVVAPASTGSESAATTARAYRQSGAKHLYGQNTSRIYKGRMPPMLHAVGVLNVEIDRSGHISRLDWLRAPRHAPDVMAEIESMVRRAAPFPAPTRMGKVVYTDTWLWHKSGRFQLDSLTEGQD